MKLELKPDLKLLGSIGIKNQYKEFNGYQMEVEENDFLDLFPFLKHWGAGEALHELFFYQLNFVDKFGPPKPQTLKAIQEDRTYFLSRENLLRMDFSQLQRITLVFSEKSNENGIKADLPPDLVFDFGQWIKKELESEKPAETTPAEKLQELNEIEKLLQSSKLKIQKAIPEVEAILKAKNPEITFDSIQANLCTYGLFYQLGHRLKFIKKIDPGEDSPFSNDFDNIRINDILKRE